MRALPERKVDADGRGARAATGSARLAPPVSWGMGIPFVGSCLHARDAGRFGADRWQRDLAGAPMFDRLRPGCVGQRSTVSPAKRDGLDTLQIVQCLRGLGR